MNTIDDIILIKRLLDVAKQQFDGHLAILKFTTNWRISFKTPSDRDDISAMAEGHTFDEAARRALEKVGAEVHST